MASSELWRNMLRRRGLPIKEDVIDIKSLRDQLRTDFLLHYGAVRDMEGIKYAVGALIGSDRTMVVKEKEMVYQSFAN